MNYYVVQVRTGMEEEFVVADKKINADSEEKYSIIFPRRVLNIRKKGKVRQEEAPVFKGYVFVETEELTDNIYRLLKGVKGFYRVLPSNNDRKALNGRDLDILNHFLGFGCKADISLAKFDENDRIQILEGPLLGLEGKIIKVDKRKGRAKVRLDAYQNSFTIDFAFEALDLSEKGDLKNSDGKTSE